MFFKSNSSIQILILIGSLGGGSMYAAALSSSSSSSSSSSALPSKFAEQLAKKLYETVMKRGDISKIVTLCMQQKIEIPLLRCPIALKGKEESFSVAEVAAIFGAKDALKLLLDRFPLPEERVEAESTKIKSKKEKLLESFLFSAVNYGLSTLETIKYLIEEQGVNCRIIHAESRSSLLLLAVEQDYSDDYILYFLWHGLVAHDRNAHNESAFTIAQKKGRKGIVNFFILCDQVRVLGGALEEMPQCSSSRESVSIIDPARMAVLPDADKKLQEAAEKSAAEQKERKQKETKIREIRQKSAKAHRRLHNLRSAELSLAATQKATMDARVDGLVNNALSQASIELAQERSQALKAEQEKAAQEERKQKEADYRAAMDALGNVISQVRIELAQERSQKLKAEQEERKRTATQVDVPCARRSRFTPKAMSSGMRLQEERKRTAEHAAREKEREDAAARKSARALVEPEQPTEERTETPELVIPHRTPTQMEVRASANTLVKDIDLSLELVAPHFIRTYGAFHPYHQHFVCAQVTKRWLYKAVLDNDVAELRGIMKTVPGASVDFDNEDGISLLKCAINKENPAMVDAILDHVHAASYWTHNNPEDLFLYATIKNNRAVIDALMKYGIGRLKQGDLWRDYQNRLKRHSHFSPYTY